MLTKSEIELNQSQHLRLSPPNEPPSFDVTKELVETIAELTVNGDLNLNGDQVTLVVLRTLLELLQRTKPRTATIPMSDIDKWRYDSTIVGAEPYADAPDSK